MCGVSAGEVTKCVGEVGRWPALLRSKGSLLPLLLLYILLLLYMFVVLYMFVGGDVSLFTVAKKSWMTP